MKGVLELSGEPWTLESSIEELFVAASSDSPALQSLKISKFDIDTTVAANVIKVLRKHDGLTTLSLEGCTGHFDTIVSVALTTNLKALSVSISKLSTVAFTSCAHALGVGLQVTSNLEKLVIQSMSNVPFTLSSEAAMSLEQGLVGNSTLRTLHIQFCRFGCSTAIRSLSRGLRSHRSLKNVKFRSCFYANGHTLNDSGLAELIRALDHSPQLDALDLSGNKCLHHGIAALATLLNRTKLRILDLSCQSIDENEFMNLSLLVAALGRNSCLESLELRFNKLSDQDMAYLAAALSHNTSIKFVGLAGNRITNTGISILASRIPVMSGLSKLVLTNNHFDHEGALALARALEVNWTLHSVECDPSIRNYESVRYFADLNWGGRRFLLGKNYKNALVPTLWPLVFERLNAFVIEDNGKERQASVIYCLLRNGSALFPT